MKDTKVTNCNPLPDEVEINLDLLSALMRNRVGGHVDRADVVTIHQCSAVWSSWRSWRSQAASATPLATARYSASALDLEMVF